MTVNDCKTVKEHNTIESILEENERRLALINAPYDPVGANPNDAARATRDFEYWAVTSAYIKQKGGGEDILFRLNRPQRKLVAKLEEMRLNNEPIRLILLKARQWGGSTCLQLYMAWLQLTHKKGLNSLIIAHYNAATDEIMDMFERMIARYPKERLFSDSQDEDLSKEGKGKKKKSPKITEKVGRGGASLRVIPRNCKVKVATAESPDSCRGGDYNLVHCSEVGLWKATKLKTPEQIVRSACSGVLYKPMTMIVYESTANGTGTFFHREYTAAKRGDSQFKPLFVAWYEIDQYSLEFKAGEKKEFARILLEGRENETASSDRVQSGAYLWWLWEKGATLEAIHWYVAERMKYGSHDLMAAEYPSDDVEAFVHSGAGVFDRYKVEALRKGCFPPRERGEVTSDAMKGPKALENVRFAPDLKGMLEIWERPYEDPYLKYIDRYIVVVDIGGRSSKADWSVIAVFDRWGIHEGKGPELVAQWRGHTDFDLLAWNAVRIATYYHRALLVIESNTIETHDPAHLLEGDQSAFLFSQLRDTYDNLYARRRTAEDVRLGAPVKYGFHTNISTKPMIISTLVSVIRDGGYVERDERCLDEYLTYERRENGSYGALPSHHDDILMTRAIALHISAFEMEAPRRVHRGDGYDSAFYRKPVSYASF